MIEQLSEILLYVNLGLSLFALMDFIALIVLCKKTAYMRIFGGVCAGLMLASVAADIVQLALKSLEINGVEYTVIAVFAVNALSFVLACAYFFVLRVRSDKKLCVATGILQFVPPIGAITAVALSKRLKTDSRAQRLIFTGYAYTYGACEEYCDVNKFDYMDASEDDLPENRDKKDIKAYLKQLKKNTLTPSGMYEYGVALAQYVPNKAKKAYKCFIKSAKSNYAPALFNLGYCFETGSLCKRNHSKARAYYQRAVAVGDKDAPMRLAILDIKSTDKKTDKTAALEYFRSNAAADNCARFNYALALERGDGTQKNAENAIDLYCECLEHGMDVAKMRLFEIMCACVNNTEHDDVFKKLALIGFEGAFGLVMKGMVAVKEKRASDAADLFLQAVRARGEWEGISRLLVGTLYLDCGKTEIDRNNGAAYVKSATSFTAIAKNIYDAIACVPKKQRKSVGSVGTVTNTSDVTE